MNAFGRCCDSKCNKRKQSENLLASAPKFPQMRALCLKNEMDIEPHKKQPQLRSIKKKELYKLLVARSDITASLNTCKLMLEKVDGMEHELYYPFYTAIVVCYSRPFTNNKPHGSLGKKWYTFDNDIFRDTHQTLLNARHELIAHSDLTVKEAFIVPPGIVVGSDNDKPIISESISIKTTMDYLARPMFEKTYNLCIYLGTRINDEIERLLEDIYGNMDLPNAPFKIRIDEGL
jgi:hypothetical protein